MAMFIPNKYRIHIKDVRLMELPGLMDLSFIIGKGWVEKKGGGGSTKHLRGLFCEFCDLRGGSMKHKRQYIKGGLQKKNAEYCVGKIMKTPSMDKECMGGSAKKNQSKDK